MKSIRIQITRDSRSNSIRFAPSDPYSEELMAALKPDKQYKVDLKEDRSRGDLNLYWAGIGLLVKNYSGPQAGAIKINGRRYDPSKLWPSSRAYHNMLMRATGHMTRHYFIDRSKPGGIAWREEPDSIALDNMDDETFKPFMEMAEHVTMEIFGWSPWQQWKDDHPMTGKSK